MGARRLLFAPGEGSWTRTKKPIKAPDLLSVSLAVSVFRTKTHFCSVPVRLPFRQSTHIYKPDKFADLRHTLHNLQPYSISRETRSEHWVATPILPAPVVPSIANS